MKEPDYPHQKPGPGDYPWQDITLYAITGWFAQDTEVGPVATAFGGYIKFSSDQTFDGMLVDSFGASTIEGILTDDKLTLSKHYFAPGHNRIPINYAFSKNEQGEWIGKYAVSDFKIDDNSTYCRLFPAIENAFGIMAGKPRLSSISF